MLKRYELSEYGQRPMWRTPYPPEGTMFCTAEDVEELEKAASLLAASISVAGAPTRFMYDALTAYNALKSRAGKEGK